MWTCNVCGNSVDILFNGVAYASMMSEREAVAYCDQLNATTTETDEMGVPLSGYRGFIWLA